MALRPSKEPRAPYSNTQTEYLYRIDEKLSLILAELQKINVRENSRRFGGGPG